MKKTEIKKKIKLIESLKGDSVSAHILEDQLYLDFIKFIAASPLYYCGIKHKAKLILKTKEIDFSRHYS